MVTYSRRSCLIDGHLNGSPLMDVTQASAIYRRPLQSPLQLAGLFDNRPDVDNCFNFYLDYLLECIADPEFPEVIRGDPRARKHYDYAIHKIEIDELARWRYASQM